VNRRAQGSAAEDMAMRYLEQQGYRTLARNYTIRGGEIDLIMRAPEGTLVFVEVKARTSLRYGGGMEAVTLRKQALICRTALHYLEENGGTDQPVRFDVVELAGGEIRHLMEAFEYREMN
jgi:putative endonuclease